MDRFIYHTTCRDCLCPTECNAAGRCESCDADRFDAYTAANRAYFARRKTAPVALAKAAIAHRHDCAVTEVALVLGGPNGRRVATVAFPGGEWSSRPHIDDLAAITDARLSA